MDHCYTFKIALVGDSGVGKTCLLNRLIFDSFDANTSPSIGVDFCSYRLVSKNNASVRLQIWDTSGQERFRSLMPTYLKSADAVVLVYATNNKTSFDNLMGWIETADMSNGIKWLVGSKSDLAGAQVSIEEVKQLAAKLETGSSEVSAKDGSNVKACFEQLVEKLIAHEPTAARGRAKATPKPVEVPMNDAPLMEAPNPNSGELNPQLFANTMLIDNEERDYTFRVCMVGFDRVGKTSILNRIVSNQCPKDDDYVPTISFNVDTWTCLIDGKRVGLTIWDFAGNEVMKMALRHLLADTHALIGVCEVGSKKTLDHLPIWLGNSENHFAAKNTLKLLLGNKSDIPVADRQFTAVDAQKLADSYFQGRYEEISAKTGSNFEKTFRQLAAALKNQSDDYVKIHGLPEKRPTEPEEKAEKEDAVLEPSEPDPTFRIVVLGDSGVGKTCLLKQYDINAFEPKFVPTIGIDFISKRITLKNGKRCKLFIWDTSGQDRFFLLLPSYLKNADAVVFVYCVADDRSFENLPRRMDTAKCDTPEKAIQWVVGNWTDSAERKVTTEQGQTFANERGAGFDETSAKNNASALRMFTNVAEKLFESFGNLPTPETAKSTQAEKVVELTDEPVATKTFKVVLLGDSKVGKSNITSRLAKGEWSPNHVATIGVEYKALQHGDVKLQFWDVAGQERYRAITSAYFRGANLGVVIYDVGNRASFDNVANWVQEFQQFQPESSIVLVANKTDLPEQSRKVSREDGEKLAAALKAGGFIEYSAKTNSSTDYEKLLDQILQSLNVSEINANNQPEDQTKPTPSLIKPEPIGNPPAKEMAKSIQAEKVTENKPKQSAEPSDEPIASKVFKVILLGDSEVGKTNILSRLANGDWSPSPIPTIGVDFKILHHNDVKLQIWDTSGQERFRTITSAYYQGANLGILVYDVTNRDSFDHIANWARQFEESATASPLLLVANKSELPETSRRVSRQEGEELAAALTGGRFTEISAKTTSKADFERLLNQIVQNLGQPADQSDDKTKRISIKPDTGTADPNYKQLFKVIVIGNSGVGKTNLVARFAGEYWSEKTCKTIGVDFKITLCDDVKLQIWDTAGEERFRTITTSYYRGVKLALFVYDVTERYSFDGIAKWVKELTDVNPTCVKWLVANKMDLRAENRKVSREEGEKAAKTLTDGRFMAMSAKGSKDADVTAFVREMVGVLLKLDSVPAEQHRAQAGLATTPAVVVQRKSACCNVM